MRALHDTSVFPHISTHNHDYLKYRWQGKVLSGEEGQENMRCLY